MNTAKIKGTIYIPPSRHTHTQEESYFYKKKSEIKILEMKQLRPGYHSVIVAWKIKIPTVIEKKKWVIFKFSLLETSKKELSSFNP